MDAVDDFDAANFAITSYLAAETVNAITLEFVNRLS